MQRRDFITGIAGSKAAWPLSARAQQGERVRLLGVLVVLGLLLNTSPLAAADSEMTQEYLTCMEKSGGVTAEMIDCTGAEKARQDARLNENYKRLMSRLSAKRKNMLLEVQRAWIRFRDANCSFYFDPEGGTAAVLAGNGCLLRATADRAKELGTLIPD